MWIKDIVNVRKKEKEKKSLKRNVNAALVNYNWGIRSLQKPLI